MTFPGPEALGRGLVIAAGADLGGDLAAAQSWDRVRVDAAVLADGSPGTGSLPADSNGRLAETVERLHRAWACRRPVVVELDLPAEAVRSLRDPAIMDVAPYLLGAEFTFLAERLHFLLWRNNYDARSGEPVWWWARKAAGLGATAGGQADVVLRDGTEAWVDGGPRQPLDLLEPLDVRILHAESLELGRLRLQPPPGGATGDGTLLAPDQRAAVEHPRGPVRVVAPAGSGKTRTLNARLLHLVDDRGVEPSLVTAVAYNNRAAAEMRERLQRPDLQVRTIHSLGWRIVRDVRPDATLLGEREVRGRLQRILPHTRRAGTDVFGPYIEALADVRIALRPPETVEVERNDVPGFAGIFDTYRAFLATHDECDYDEQVYEAIRLLLVDPELRARWQMRCRHLLVDEFQDLTPAYLLMLRLLASPGLDVFGVGDDDQTIYGYAGADPGFLLEYERLFPGAGEAALEVSYRCPADVVTAVGHLLVHNQRRLPKTVRAASATQSESFGIVRLPDEGMAGAAAAAVTGWLAEGVPESEIAVLGRVNSMLLPTLAALDEAGVGARCLLGTSLLHRNLIRAALAWMRLALRSDAMDPRDLTEAARRPGRKINRLSRDLLEGAWDVSLEQLAALGTGLNERHREYWSGFVADVTAASRLVAAGCDTRTLVEFLMQEIGLGRAAGSLDSGRTRPDRATHADDLLALRRTAAVYSDPASFGRQLASLLRRTSAGGNAERKAEAEGDGDGVLLTSIHRVKGLEWDRVLVFAADEALMPHQLAADIEEERRVLHVAVTRCRHQVVVLADERKPSPFLDELEGRPPKRRPERGPASATSSPRPAIVKASAPAPGDEEPYDEALFESLRQWRLGEARQHDLRAFHVFTNRALRNIARGAPRTMAQLAAIHGVGRNKVANYGEAVLEVIETHLETGDGRRDAVVTTPADSGVESRAEADTAAAEKEPEPGPRRPATDALRHVTTMSSRPTPTAEEREPYDQELFETLRRWRFEESQRQGVPAYVVFGDRTLKSIACHKPASESELAVLWGVGPARLAAHGEAVLEIVHAHRSGDLQSPR